MTRFAVLLACAGLTACATLPAAPEGGERARLWEQAHSAYSRDSVRVAAAAFQRLVTDHPHSREAHEARFYLGVLALEPRSGLDLSAAGEHLTSYLAADSLGRFRSYHQREARTLLRLAGEMRRGCAERTHPALRCEGPGPVRAGEPPAPPPAGGEGGAEAARLRRELAERDEQIRRLREELERIRNTLAPRRTPR